MEKYRGDCAQCGVEVRTRGGIEVRDGGESASGKSEAGLATKGEKVGMGGRLVLGIGSVCTVSVCRWSRCTVGIGDYTKIHLHRFSLCNISAI